MAPLLSLLVLFVVWAGRTGNAELGIELAAEEAAAAGVMAAESFCLLDPAKPDDPLHESDERRTCVDDVVAQVLESHPATWACLGGARGAAKPADGSGEPLFVDDASGAVIVRVECDSDVAVAPLQGLFPVVPLSAEALQVRTGSVAVTAASPGTPADPSDTPVVPQVSVTAGGGVTEGQDATFSVTASPVPAASLAVSVTVSQSGDFGVTTGAYTFMVGTGGTARFIVATVGDGTDEPDGSVTVSLDAPAADAGYTVSSTRGTATLVVADDDGPPQVVPQVSVTAGGGVTEGQDATFSVTASPVPAASLAVSVTVSQSGDFGVSTGKRTVTVGTDGTAALTVATVGDSTDEPDGSVTVLLDAPGADAGYTVSATRRIAAVAVADDDGPPQVSVTAGGGVTEGQDATFSVTASPVPAASLAVSVTVSQSGDFGVSTGARTVTVGTGGTATLTIPTVGDGTNEPDGSVTVSLDAPGADAGYTVSATSRTATVAVADDDVPSITLTAGVAVTEGQNATFTVAASPVPAASLAVSVTVSQSGDFGVSTGARTVTVGTGGTATLTIPTVGDSNDEPDGSVSVTLAAGRGYEVGTVGAVTVSVADDDDPPPEPEIPNCQGTTKPTVSVADATARRGEDLEFVISLSCRSSEDVGFIYAVAYNTDWDTGPRLDIASGETHATVAVPTAGVGAGTVIRFHIVFTFGAANVSTSANAEIIP
ncbi:hypothetical protein [Candidatus Poriferisodalis sp.]|uniref:hypothetical protein n=1 Tax=Candidatus Poriferisodalis sp. TaxID=3101277 RepID=UPI003B01788B